MTHPMLEAVRIARNDAIDKKDDPNLAVCRTLVDHLLANITDAQIEAAGNNLSFEIVSSSGIFSTEARFRAIATGYLTAVKAELEGGK